MRYQVLMAVLIACLFSTWDAMSQTPRYFGMTLVNENEKQKLEEISASAESCGANALFLTIQWGSIEGFGARLIRQENPNDSEEDIKKKLWLQYDKQIETALAHNMKIGLNIAVSTGDDASNAPSDRYGVTTNDNWLKEERMLAVSYDGQTEAVFQISGGGAYRDYGPPIYLQFVMTSLAAQSTKDRIASFTTKVMNKYKYLLDSNKLLYINLIFTRQGEGEYDGSSTKYDGPNTDLGLGNGALLDYSQPMVQGFRTWLLNKYGNLNALSGAWNRQVTDINNVIPKRPSGTFKSAFQGPDGRDWFLYRTAVLKEANQIFKNAAKAVDNRVKVITHHGSMFDGHSTKRGTFAFNEIGAGLDGIKFNDDVDGFLGDGTPKTGYDHRFSVDLARSNMSPGAIIINEVGYSGLVSGFSKLVQESFNHGASMVSVFKFEDLLTSTTQQGAADRATIKDLANNYVAGKNVTVVNPSQTATYTLSNMIDSDGCATNNRDANSSGCDAYKNWTTARNAAGGAPVNIIIQNDLPNTTTPCSYTASATSAVPNVNINQSVQLFGNCSGSECTGATYSWTIAGNATSISTAQNPTVQVPGTAGQYTYTVKVTKGSCVKTGTVTITVLNPNNPGDNVCVSLGDQCSGNSSEIRSYTLNMGSGGTLPVKLTYKAHEGLSTGRIRINNGTWQTFSLAQTSNSEYVEVSIGNYPLNSGNNTIELASGGGYICFRQLCAQSTTTPPQCNYTITASAAVAGNTATLTAACSGDCTGLSYSWTGGGTSTTKTVSLTSSTQTFTVTATKTGCSKTANVSVPPISTGTECVKISMVSAEVLTPATPKFITNVAGVPKIRVANASDPNSQIWKVQSSGSDVYFIAQGGTSGSGNVLGVRNGGHDIGNAIDLQPLSTGAGHQLWTRTIIETVNNRARYKLVRSGYSYRLGSPLDNGNGSANATETDFYLVNDPNNDFGANKWSFDVVGCPQPNNPNPSEVVCGTVSACSGNTSEIRTTNLSMTSGGVYKLKVTYKATEGATTGQVRIGSGAWVTFSAQATSGSEIKEVTIPNITLATGNNSVQLSVASGGSFLCFETVCTASNSGARIGAAEEPEVAAENPGNMVVSANPNSGTFNVSFYLSADKSAVLSVVDMQGKTWHQRQIAGKGQHNEKVTLSNPASGTYLVSLRRTNAIETKKIIVVR